MLESSMRRVLIKVLYPLGAFAVENGIALPGTPDIAYVGGWIECKATERWPKNAKTKVRLDHELTPEQKTWQFRWERSGGKAYVMLTVGREWLLFEGKYAALHLGYQTRKTLLENAIGHWTKIPSFDELAKLL